jgi:drug/metabolite transporter (DMT)-like permease
MILFAAANGFLLVALSSFSAIQTMMLRLWALFVMAAIIAARRGGLLAALKARRPWLQLARGAFLVADQLMFTLTLMFLGLVEVSALYAITPLLAMALAVPLLGERIGWRHWLAVSAGFAGALLIIRPGSAVFDPFALLAVFGALMYALYAIATRLGSLTDSHETSLLYTSVFGAIATTPFGLLDWHWGDQRTWLFLVISLGFSLLAHATVIRAYALAPASVLQPFNYAGLAASTLIGITFFAERPDALTIAGIAAIAAAGLAVALYEARRRQ